MFIHMMIKYDVIICCIAGVPMLVIIMLCSIDNSASSAYYGVYYGFIVAVSCGGTL